MGRTERCREPGAGLPDIRFHDLRHTCATLLLTKGVHPRVVSARSPKHRHHARHLQQRHTENAGGCGSGHGGYAILNVLVGKYLSQDSSVKG